MYKKKYAHIKRCENRGRVLLWVCLGSLCLLALTFAVSSPVAAGAAEEGQEKASDAVWELTYMASGQKLCSERIGDGESPVSIPKRVRNSSITAWKNQNDAVVEPEKQKMHSDLTLYAVPGRALRWDAPCMAARDDGLFHPEDPLTREDAVRAVYSLLEEPMAAGCEVRDVSPRSEGYEAVCALVGAGYIALRADGRFQPEEPITKEELIRLLLRVFAPAEVAKRTEELGRELTRGEGAELLSGLLGREIAEEPPYYPDVSPGSRFYAAISAVGIPSLRNTERLKEGLLLCGGYLYAVDGEGYFAADTMRNTLYFGKNGRFTSGDPRLDELVALTVRTRTDETGTQEERLRALYDFLRDRCVYSERNDIVPGQNGWETECAVTMLTTGKGDCYNFAAAFWALARGLGFDAVAVTGYIGRDSAPHCWVEIEMDGILCVFDPETDMSYRLDPNGWHPDCFQMPPEAAAIFRYVPVG